jgi:hypothetical protein
MKHWHGVLLAPLALAACKVSYTADEGNSAITAGRNSTTGRFEADIKADGRDIRIDAQGGEIRIGNETRVDLDDGDVRASIRTDGNGSITIHTNAL